MFFYSGNLNNKRTEEKIKQVLFSSKVWRDFCPRTSQWATCTSMNYAPHSNECGPCTTLALAVMLAHPDPHSLMLLPYMNPNLVQQSRIWMASKLLSAAALLLPVHPPSACTPPQRPLTIQSRPSRIVPWPRNQDRNSAGSQDTRQHNQKTIEGIPLPKGFNQKTTPRQNRQWSQETIGNTRQATLSHQKAPPQKIVPKIAQAITTQCQSKQNTGYLTLSQLPGRRKRKHDSTIQPSKPYLTLSSSAQPTGLRQKIPYGDIAQIK